MTGHSHDKYLIFTDGACSGNPGPGGYGAILLSPEGQVREIGGGEASTTNNRMELTAIIEALNFLPKGHDCVWILTDSTYVIHGITKWVHSWRRKGWKTAEDKEVTNQDLWENLFDAVYKAHKSTKFEWKYVRGHSGTPGNERCDKIAVAYSQNQFVSLFYGSEQDYSFDLHQLPEDLSVPPMNFKNSEKSENVYYLSYVDRNLQRHETWAECEARVKGRSGAKFKKVKSKEEEEAVLKSWGIQ